MHLGVYLFNIGVWAAFSIVILEVYDQDESHKEWYLAFAAFECGILANAILITSIVYAIYWLHQTGEIIKRDRERINKVKNTEIEYQIAHIK